MKKTKKENKPEFSASETIRKISGCIDVLTGDLVNEIGKDYMGGLHQAVESNRCMNKPVLWFLIRINKDILDSHKVTIAVAAIEKPFSYYHENLDVWKYDYEKEKLELVYSLPHRTEMKNFLREPKKYSKDLVKWCKEYLAQDKVDINDPSSLILS